MAITNLLPNNLLMKKLILISVLHFIFSNISYAQTDFYKEIIVIFSDVAVETYVSKTNNNGTAVTFSQPELNDLIQSFSVSQVYETFSDVRISKTQNVARANGQVYLPEMSNVYTFKVSDQADRYDLINELKELPYIISAELNGIAKPSVTPDDEYFDKSSAPGSGGLQWGLLNTGQNYGTPDADIDASEAWEISTGNSSTKIGIIDGGVENWHEDLSGKVTGDSGWGWNGHGFHVAGIAAATSNNTHGIAGVDWNANIISQRVDGKSDSGIFNAVIDAINSGSDIINSSYGLFDGDDNVRYSLLVNRAYALAYKANVISVASMGNREYDTPGITQYPAGFGQGIIAVGNSNRNDQRSGSSSTGSHIDVVAPGTSILSTVPYTDGVYDYYDYKSGSSMSAPVVSGIAGLMIDINPNLYNDDVEKLIQMSADKVFSMSGQVLPMIMAKGE